MLYLVRWPDLSACIVRARDEDHLMETLDEVADPSECKWSRYDGPLWIEFELDVKVEFPSSFERDGAPLSADQIEFTGVEEFACGAAPMSVSAAPCDTGSEMENAVLKRCFPKLSRAIDELHDRHEDLQVDSLRDGDLAEIESALLGELDTYIRGRRRDSARKPIRQSNAFDYSNKPLIELTELEQARFHDQLGKTLEEPMFDAARSGEGKLLVVAAVLGLPTGESRVLHDGDEWGDGEGAKLSEHTVHLAAQAVRAGETVRLDHIRVQVLRDRSCVCDVTTGEAQEHPDVDDILAPSLEKDLDNARTEVESESVVYWLVVLTTADGENRIVYANMDGFCAPQDPCGEIVRRARRLKWLKPGESVDRAQLRLSVSGGGWTASIKLEPVR